MKKLLTLIIILISTNLFADIKPTIKSSDETLYILSGKIDNKYPITMYLTIDNDTDMISGNYYYNKHRKIIYLQAGELDNKSEVILREYFDDEKGNSISSGEFRGAIKYDKDEGVIFKGIWYNDKQSLDFILRLDKNSKINEIKTADYEYEFISELKSDTTTPEFTSGFSILEISNHKNLVGIKKINKYLKNFFDANNLYLEWVDEMKNLAKNYPNYSFDSDRDSWIIQSLFSNTYTDNISLSLVNEQYAYTGGAHGNTDYKSLIFYISSGKLIDGKVTDLIIDINDKKLIKLLRKKLINHAKIMMGGGNSTDQITDDDAKDNYFKFDEIRLNSNFHLGVDGITFIYNQYEIAAYVFGAISIKFSYDELKLFVKKSSKLYYLFK